jgi:hypothetical protein
MQEQTLKYRLVNCVQKNNNEKRNIYFKKCLNCVI